MKSTKIFIAFLLMMASCGLCVHAQIPKHSIRWDKHSLILDDKRVVPVMGEVHYSRLPQDEWREEVRAMKDGGVTMIATYVFWNHVEEQEGVFNWSGQRDLRAFLEVCKEEDIPVVLRLGPFCHGEVRNGGIPDWMFSKGCKMREENPTFLKYTERLYRQIFSQVMGLQWKDGGPVVAAQFDNEYRGRGSYLMSLKAMAEKIGFSLPFYTRTGWPELRTPVPFGEMIPLYGDYADGFWERSTSETAGNYYKAFNFKAFRSSTAIATEQLGKQEERVNEGDELYPYFTCELGGGMIPAYHRRPFVYPKDAYSMAMVKLGSGSNLLGYYMYHGGTNPEALMPGMCDDGKALYLNETQRTIATNYNDMPVKTYDFQAPLGEFGQRNEHYYMLRKLHLFMHDYGEMLAPMEAVFPCAQDIKKGEDDHLRWSYRTDGNSAFVFINNYERLQDLTDKRDVTFDVCGVKFPQQPMCVPAGSVCMFPVNVEGITYATAQLIAKRDGKIYLEQIAGMPTEICVNGRVMRNVRAKGLSKPIYNNVYLLTSHEAERLFLRECANEEACDGKQKTKDDNSKDGKAKNKKSDLKNNKSNSLDGEKIEVKKVKDADAIRTLTIGVQKVVEEPTDADFKHASVYEIFIPADCLRKGRLLSIDYRGDCARLYADGKLVADNFYNGRPFLMGLWRLPQACNKLELRILPLQEKMPVYFPREADLSSMETVIKNVRIIKK